MGTFDTSLMEALLSIGVPPERARSVVDAFDRSVDARYSLHAQVLATKRDLAELETRLVREIGETRERIAAIDARLDRTSTSLDARIEAMDARIDASSAALAMRIAETKTDLLKWTLGALTAQTALLLSAMKLL
jgi:DNA anti-recombination protein RmuC